MNQSSIAPLLADNILGSSDNSFVIAEWQDEGGPAGPPRLIAPRHLHHKEAWYILEGTLRVQSGENEIEAPAGPTIGNCNPP
jgi:mannose-6-phosphate isomerase-like protein (cupin superfamily)